MLPEFSTEPSELPWQPKLCKNKPKFVCMVGILGLENSNMLIKISEEQSELP